MEKAHITVLAAHVEEEQLDKAKRVIERVLRNQIVKAVPTEFDVELRGIEAFGDKIVYAEVDKGEDHLRLINEKLLIKTPDNILGIVDAEHEELSEQ